MVNGGNAITVKQQGTLFFRCHDSHSIDTSEKNSTSVNEHLNIRTVARLVCSMKYSRTLMDTKGEVI